MERNTDGAEMQVPLFVQVKEEPNSDSNGDIEESSFESNDTANSGCVVKIEKSDADQDIKSEESLGGILKSESYGEVLDNSMETASHVSTAYQQGCCEARRYPEENWSKEVASQNINTAVISSHDITGSISRGSNQNRHIPENTKKVFKKGCVMCSDQLSCSSPSNFQVASAGQDNKSTLKGSKGKQGTTVRKSAVRKLADKSFREQRRKEQEDALVPHKQIKSVAETYKCTQCHKSFSSRVKHTNHVLAHIEGKQYECSHCGKAFAKKDHLITHTRIHTGEKPYKCSQCPRAFSNHGSFAYHMKIHRKEKPYKCSQCDKSFALSSNLTAHMSIHTGDKPYRCSQCDKAFNRKFNLTKHMRIHAQEKPYKCSQCKKAFSHKGSLTNHKRVHMEEKPYKCNQCHKEFVYRCSLMNHMGKHI